MAVTTSRRIFARSVTDKWTVFYSKIFEDGVMPEFNSALTITLGPTRKITAMGTIDDKVILFEKDRINMVYGEGPDNTGANGDFSVEPVHSVVGCDSPKSVIEIEAGLIFFSSVTRQFHLLTRDMQLVDIGAAVETATGASDFEVANAYIDTKEHEVRFVVNNIAGDEYGPTPTTGSGIPENPPRVRRTRDYPPSATMAYNYRYQKWSFYSSSRYRFSRHVIYKSEPVGIVTGIDAFSISDDDSKWENAPATRLETPWIKVNQLQNYGAIFNITFNVKYWSSWEDLGSGIQAGDLQVTLRYDNENDEAGTSHVYRFRANQDFQPQGRQALALKVRPGRRKCQSIRMIIEEVDTTAVEISEPTYIRGRGWQVLGADIEYGLKSYELKTVPRRRVR